MGEPMHGDRTTLAAQSPFRFVRLNPRFDESETLSRLKNEVDCDPYPIPVPWLEGYYALPGDFSLHQSALFQSARIYGQDVSSGAAVAALLTEDHDCNSRQTSLTKSSLETTNQSLRVLDLCCCPGLKLCAIADTLQRQGHSGLVVGVDVSETRMALCKRIVLKYQIQAVAPEDGKESVRIRLYCNDGTTLTTPANNLDLGLNLVFDSVVASEDEAVRLGKRKRMNKSSKSREQKRLKELIALDTELVSTSDTNTMQMRRFDRVLVDAECSTDGSIVHVQKRLAKDQRQQSRGRDSAASTSSMPWSSQEKRAELCALQRNLASTGFQLLKSGGTMVYSTCSLEEEQNEGVVRWLLNEFADARIIPAHFSCSSGRSADGDLQKEGTLPGTIRFLPNVDARQKTVDADRLFGSGFFLAKILKR